MVIILDMNATMVTVLPRCWCFYDCYGTMLAIVKFLWSPLLPSLPMFPVFTGW